MSAGRHFAPPQTPVGEVRQAIDAAGQTQLFGWFCLLTLAEMNSGVTAVLVDELDLTGLDSGMPVEQVNQRRAKLKTGG